MHFLNKRQFSTFLKVRPVEMFHIWTCKLSNLETVVAEACAGSPPPPALQFCRISILENCFYTYVFVICALARNRYSFPHGKFVDIISGEELTPPFVAELIPGSGSRAVCVS